MPHHRIASAALLLSATAASATTIFNDTSPSTADWFYVANASIGPAGYNLSPTLTGGSDLRFSTTSYTNNLAATTHLFDNTYVVRPFGSTQSLAVGDKLVLDFTITSPAGSELRGTRAVNFRFLGAGSETLPSADTLFGTPDTTNPIPNDADLTYAGSSAINLGSAVTSGNTQITAGVGNTATGNVGSTKLFAAGGGNFTGAASVPSAWGGSRIVFEVERIADLSGFAAFSLTTTLFDALNAPFASYTVSTTNATGSSNFGSGATIDFHAVAIGLGNGGQVNVGQSRFVDFTLDNISVSAIPEPSSVAATAAALALAATAFVRRSRR